MSELNFLEKLLEKYNQISKIYSNEKINGKEFNVFNLINQIYGIGETKHSRFLAFLLNPNAEHGKGKSFLNEFLKHVEINYDEDDMWEVSAEKNNIDILLKRTYPRKSTIIIENKSNWADDQDNQLYRYWYNEMYDSNKDYENAETFLEKDDRIIYLAPNEYKLYEASSLCKPDDYNCKISSLKPSSITNLYFSTDINQWLQKCLEQLDNCSGTRMKFFIEDYLQFWQETNFKNEIFMKEIDNYFSDKKTDWINFAEAAKYVSQVNEQWVQKFVKELEKINIPGWKFESFKPDEGLLSKDDFRWFINDSSSLSFVYESHKGLTIWKKDFNFKKESFKVEISSISSHFKFIDDNSTNYIMNYDDESIIFDNEDEFAWKAGNTNLAEQISVILRKFLTPEVRDLFDKIDSE